MQCGRVNAVGVLGIDCVVNSTSTTDKPLIHSFLFLFPEIRVTP